MIDLRDPNTTSTSIPHNRQKDSVSSPFASQPHLSSLSPYLNYDPVYFPPSQPEFIFPEGAVKQRGRFELAFSQIGAACIAGAGMGGATGFYRGLKATTLAGQTGKLRRTQYVVLFVIINDAPIFQMTLAAFLFRSELINHVMKHGSSLANTLGVVSVMYSGFGVLFSWARGTDDSFNTLAAASATGMLFKSTAGLKRCAIGGGIGLGLASAFCLWNSREAFSDIRHHRMNPA